MSDFPEIDDCELLDSADGFASDLECLMLKLSEATNFINWTSDEIERKWAAHVDFCDKLVRSRQISE